MLGFFVFMAGYGSCLYLVFGYVFLHCVIKAIKQQEASPKLFGNASCCTPLGIRTLDPLIKSQLLYQLS